LSRLSNWHLEANSAKIKRSKSQLGSLKLLLLFYFWAKLLKNLMNFSHSYYLTFLLAIESEIIAIGANSKAAIGQISQLLPQSFVMKLYPR